MSTVIPARTFFLDLLGIAASMGSLLGTDAASGGWIVGGIFTAALFTVGIIITSAMKNNSPIPMLAFVALGLGLSTGFGWFPTWMFFVVFVICLVPVIGFMRSGGGSP